MGALNTLKIEARPANRGNPKEVSENQEQTKNSFGYQWHLRHTYESDGVQDFARTWLVDRYCSGNPDKLAEWLAGGDKIILDAGCGAGYSAIALFGDLLKKNQYLGVDISDAIEVAEKRFGEEGLPGDFLQENLMELPIPEHSVDMIFSEGVLHHTDNTEAALQYLATKLKKGGRFLFYVYAKKAPIREFTDDHVREHLGPLSNEDAWKALIPLTKLGIALGKLNIEIDIPEDVPALGIKKGKQDLQRFFYWNVCKTFYQPEWSEDEMNHMNFDWFRPMNCFRHTPDEVETFCQNSMLSIEHMDVQEAGITVVARRQ